jgi:hypothetical protein
MCLNLSLIQPLTKKQNVILKLILILFMVIPHVIHNKVEKY